MTRFLMIMWVGGSSEEDEEEINITLNQCPVFPECMLLTEL
jgi:hypothetical protein